MSLVRPQFTAAFLALLMAFTLFAARSAHAEPDHPGVININSATADELMFLPRVGESKAQRIIEHRTKTPFKSVNELARVKGIGLKSLRALKPFIRIEGASTLSRKLTQEDLERGAAPKAAPRAERPDASLKKSR